MSWLSIDPVEIKKAVKAKIISFYVAGDIIFCRHELTGETVRVGRIE